MAGVGGRDAPRIALGSVAPTVVRLPQTEAALAAGASIADAQRILLDEIAPIDDVRSTADYRRRVAANLLARFWLGTPSEVEWTISPRVQHPRHESRRRRPRGSGTQCPHAVPRARAVAQGVDVDLVGLEGTPLPRAITGDPRITVHRLRRPCSVIGKRSAWATRLSRSSMPPASASGCGRRCRQLPRPDLVLVQNPPAFPTLKVTLVRARRARRAVRHRLAQPRVHALALRLGQLASGGAAGALVRAARRAAVDANLCVSRGLAAFLESRFGVDQRARAVRPPRVDLRADRARRARAATVRRCSCGSAFTPSTLGFIVCPTSWTEDEDFDVVIDAVVRLEDRIRGWEAASETGGSRTWSSSSPATANGAPSSNGALPACRRGAFSCAHAGSSRRTTRALSAAPTSACACIVPRRASTSR